MSMNKDAMIFQAMLELGRKESDSHHRYIKFISGLLEIIHDEEQSLQERILALHKLGLADNKIDKNPTVSHFFKLISEERDSQEVYLENLQFHNLKESNRRCNYYIEIIAREISPSALDVQETDDEDDNKAKFDLSKLAM